MTGVGTWSALITLPRFVAHGALIYNPAADHWKVMLFAGGFEESQGTRPDLRRSYLWDPDTNTFTDQLFALLSTTDRADPFCSHHCHLKDGRLLVMGGATYEVMGGSVRATWIFDPTTETWSRAGDMAFDRWYPTSVALPDGGVLVASGRPTTGGATRIVAEMEVFDPDTLAWSTLPASANRLMDVYPSLHLVPAGPHAGKIIYTGTHDGDRLGPAQTAMFDPRSASWTELGPLTADRRQGFSVQVPPAETARFLVFGGGHLADSDTAEMIDLLAPVLAWRRVGGMRYERSNANGVILPNGKVFAFGGRTSLGDSVLAGEIFDPTTGGWIETADMQQERGYHSVGVLLPDGRVLCAGEEPNMEIYSPPYIAEPSRPEITSVLRELHYGDRFTIATPSAPSIDRVVLIRPIAMTHQTDSEQRYVRLSFMLTDSGSLLATAPANPNLAPPGFYMLFVVDAAGTPSVAKFIQLLPRVFLPPKLVKDVKDLKEKEKEIKDFKDKDKDFKELKEKELKDKDKDLKEKDHKDKDKEKEKDFKELKDKDKELPEGGFEGLPHFIPKTLRPDLTAVAIAREPALPTQEEIEAAKAERDQHDQRRPKKPKGK